MLEVTDAVLPLRLYVISLVLFIIIILNLIRTMHTLHVPVKYLLWTGSKCL